MRTETPSREEMQKILDALEQIAPLIPQLKKFLAAQHPGPAQDAPREQSYVQLAIAVLEELGRPTPITVLLEQIRLRRKNPNITRGAVETSLLRHLSVKGDDTLVVKLSPGTYALRHHIVGSAP